MFRNNHSTIGYKDLTQKRLNYEFQYFMHLNWYID